MGTAPRSAARMTGRRDAAPSGGPSERSGTCATSSLLPLRCEHEDLRLRVPVHEAEAGGAEDLSFETLAPTVRPAEERLGVHVLPLAQDEEGAAGVGRHLVLDGVELIGPEVVAERGVLVLLDLLEPPGHV